MDLTRKIYYFSFALDPPNDLDTTNHNMAQIYFGEWCQNVIALFDNSRWGIFAKDGSLGVP